MRPRLTTTFAIITAVALLAGCGNSSTQEAAAPTVQSPADENDKPDAQHDHSDHDRDHGDGGYALSEADDGFLLSMSSTNFPVGVETNVAFTILDEQGDVQTEFEEVHEARMHLLMVSDDLRTYGHVHPQQNVDGLWEVPFTFERDGRWRLVTDFSAASGSYTALGTFVNVGNAANLEPGFTKESRTATSGNFTVELTGDTAHERPRPLTFTVRTADGDPVTTFEDYLGARGHLVGFFQDDYAFTHLHPNSNTGDALIFTAPAMAHGYWALFLQMSFDGEVHTFPFVIDAL